VYLCTPLSLGPLISVSLTAQNLSLSLSSSQVKLAKEAEVAILRKRKSMEGPDAEATAPLGCDDKLQPQNENPATVASGSDASSQPSTSDANPNTKSSQVSVFDTGYYSSSFSDDTTQIAERPGTPYVGDKVNFLSIYSEVLIFFALHYY
jgi:hypothetical protein